MTGWQEILLVPAKLILSQVTQFLVNVLGVIVILLIGWLIARFAKTVLIKGLRVIKVDELSDSIELDSLLAKGGIKYSLSELIGVVIYWLLLLVTFVVAINAVGLTIAAELLNRIILYIPQVISALFILIISMFVATLLKNIVQTMAVNAGLSQDKLLGKIVEVIVMIFAIAIALEQLNIGARIIELTLAVLLGALGLSIALAFGLGCRDIAGKYVADFVEKLKSKK